MMNKRIYFLDVLRGIAALAVLFQHLFESNGQFFDITKNYFQLGVFGVSLFFLISGFIIPYSLERANNLKIFWIRRLFRIYPLYLFCLIIYIVLSYYKGEQFGLFQIILNAFLITKPASIRIIGLSWTLSSELIFYGILSFLSILSWHKKSITCIMILAILSLCLSLVLDSMALLSLLLFFSGILFHDYFFGKITFKQLNIYLISVTLVVLVTIFLGTRNVIDVNGTLSFIPKSSATLLAYILLYLSIILSHHNFFRARILLYLGELSYSIYLVQSITLLLKLNHLLTFVLTIIISIITYHFIEKKFMQIGSMITK